MSAGPEGGDAVPTLEASTSDPLAADETEETQEASPRRNLVRPLAVLTVIFFVGTVAMAVLSASLSSELNEEQADNDDRREIQQVAAQFAERLLTYDFRRLDESKRGVLELATGKFRNEYERAFRTVLDQLFTTTQARSVGRVIDLFTGPIEDDTATAVVVVDAVVEGTTGRRETVDSYIQLTLVKVAGSTWRVDDVTNLNFGQPAGPATTTTAPSG